MTAAALAIIGLAVRAIYSMGKLTQDVQALRETVGIELQAHKEAQSLELQAHKEAQTLELQALEQRLVHSQELMRTEMHAFEQRIIHSFELLSADMQRMFEAMVSHTHDADGNVVFRVPPASALSEAEESQAD
jgi:hypothetical protein